MSLSQSSLTQFRRETTARCTKTVIRGKEKVLFAAFYEINAQIEVTILTVDLYLYRKEIKLNAHSQYNFRYENVSENKNISKK